MTLAEILDGELPLEGLVGAELEAAVGRFVKELDGQRAEAFAIAEAALVAIGRPLWWPSMAMAPASRWCPGPLC